MNMFNNFFYYFHICFFFKTESYYAEDYCLLAYNHVFLL